MKEIIKLKDITLSYHTPHNRVDVLNEENLIIKEGEFTVIYGPSGSGKTTILNLIAGFIKPNAGEVKIENQNIASFSEKEICKYRNKKIGYIFQFFNLLQNFTSEENVSVPLLLSGITKEDIDKKVHTLLEKVKMGHRKKHYPMELSGGEQQRVAIARALANNPSIILADEPTGNLDEKTGETILKLLSDIHAEGKTLVVVTHDRRIAKYATRIIEMS